MHLGREVSDAEGDVTLGEMWRAVSELKAQMKTLPRDIAEEVGERIKVETQLALVERVAPLEARVGQLTAFAAWGGTILSAIITAIVVKVFAPIG